MLRFVPFSSQEEHLEWLEGLSPEIQGQNLVLTVLNVPIRSTAAPKLQGYLAHKKQRPPGTLQ